MKADEVWGESEYSLNSTVPLEMNEEYISLSFKDFTHPLSDEEMRFNAAHLLRIHQDINNDDITLECQDGVITLRGIVDNQDMKELTTRLCEFVPGVKKIINNLEF